MTRTFTLLASVAAIACAPAGLSAQTADLGEPLAEGGEVETTETQASGEDAEGGLTFTVTDESDWSDIGVAIPAFATDRNRPTPASSDGTEALGREIARVITANLRDNGLFKPVGPDSLPQPSFAQITAPAWNNWSGRGAEMLVHGYVRARDDDKLVVGCYLYDVALKDELIREGWVVRPADWRRAAHKCSDLIYARLTGEDPFFDSRIAYIAETGPKDNRVKRLAVMDSDGANHRFITLGSATALTPRYSPDYSKILYLSYVDGNPRIYVYDIGSGRQKLVTENANPTLAPRWSPDGRHILYSMAVAGNTDIYRVPVTGGQAERLTDAPGIDIAGSYSPDGSKIVFESDRSGAQQCYVMDADGSNQKRISFFGGRCATPEWSPRGDQIAFTRIAGDFNVAVMTPSGGNMRVLTRGWQDEAPTWAPNGRIIQFFRTARNSGRSSLWQVDLTGRNERRLPTPVDASDPAWGPIRP
ncbi:Tol-Pal system beta propeller repeat protein TolB [Erythrobacter sp. HL-111]|uniref:Tol-Pal system beta propeller repeat protein TolB n=1 Tax=Erythrobacter sp. HL-111 TaxID=1798193 RepID=UPI0006D9C74E|nr:Tol-Pal system beta propeller repeat protein TolB [Erythrobacter sp. HL-111]KPP83400.1 MAG: TolA energization system periplasmic component TolB [Erythrobacteraceae bacterium HL-111]SDS40812.1 TolB protein [Erythrobacter sp. HL-111]